jgi:hypothetical protein
MILKSLYKSASSMPLSRSRQTNALPDRIQFHMLVRVIASYIGDNGRTLHVLSVFVPDRCLNTRTQPDSVIWSTVIDRLEKISLTLFLSTSDQARLPAKFKHINKRWKRNQKGYP